MTRVRYAVRTPSHDSYVSTGSSQERIRPPSLLVCLLSVSVEDSFVNRTLGPTREMHSLE